MYRNKEKGAKIRGPNEGRVTEKGEIWRSLAKGQEGKTKTRKIREGGEFVRGQRWRKGSNPIDPETGKDAGDPPRTSKIRHGR